MGTTSGDLQHAGHDQKPYDKRQHPANFSTSRRCTAHPQRTPGRIARSKSGTVVTSSNSTPLSHVVAGLGDDLSTQASDSRTQDRAHHVEIGTNGQDLERADTPTDNSRRKADTTVRTIRSWGNPDVTNDRTRPAKDRADSDN